MKYTNLDLKKMEELEKLTGEKVKEWTGGTDSAILSDGTEWKILTEEEADKVACEEIRNSLWAFNADFIIAHCENITDYNDQEKVIETIETLQLNLCESCNDIVFLLIGGEAGFKDFATAAIDVDGRESFIAWYDDVEHEAGDFYAYRID